MWWPFLKRRPVLPSVCTSKADVVIYSVVEKVVRDYIVSRMILDGETPECRELEGDEWDEKIRLKIVEEANELLGANTEEKEYDEAGDLLEAFYAWFISRGLSLEKLKRVMEAKRIEKGGFDERIYVVRVGRRVAR